MLGTLPINSIMDSILFNSGACHSFISERFAFPHGICYEELYPPLVVHSPGSQWHTSMVSHNNQIKIEGLVFLPYRIALKSLDIDVILGMDWLSANQVVIDCATKSVQLTHPSDQIVYFSSHTSEPQLYAPNEQPYPTLMMCR